MDRERTSRSLLLDIALAAGLCAVGVYEVLVAPLAEDVVRGPVWLNLLAVAATTVPLALYAARAVLGGRRRGCRDQPAAPCRRAAGDLPAASIALLVATYTVASYAPLQESLLAVGFGAMAVAVAVVQGTGTDAAPDPLASAILYGMVWLVGRVVEGPAPAGRAAAPRRDAHAAEAVADERAASPARCTTPCLTASPRS